MRLCVGRFGRLIARADTDLRSFSYQCSCIAIPSQKYQQIHIYTGIHSAFRQGHRAGQRQLPFDQHLHFHPRMSSSSSGPASDLSETRKERGSSSDEEEEMTEGRSEDQTVQIQLIQPSHTEKRRSRKGPRMYRPLPSTSPVLVSSQQRIFTLEDLSESDSDSSLSSATEAHLAQFDQPTKDDPKTLREMLGQKPFLSVSDLTRPLYCATQTYYALLTRAHLPARLRPTSVVSPTGHEQPIVLNLPKAETADKLKSKGTKIHAKAERELRPVRVEVEVQTAEESFGLQLCKLLQAVLDFVPAEKGGGSSEKCREVPIWGFLHLSSTSQQAQMVHGIIDEIQASHGSGCSLKIKEMKTRRTNSLPRAVPLSRDSQKLQAMLYHELLSQHLRGRFDWPEVLRLHGLDTERVFGERFKREVMQIFTPVQQVGLDHVETLRDLTEAIRCAFVVLDGIMEDSTELIYKWQKSPRASSELVSCFLSGKRCLRPTDWRGRRNIRPSCASEGVYGRTELLARLHHLIARWGGYRGDMEMLIL